MEENVVFKTAAVGGFEKRAVLDYIYSTNEKHEEEKAELLSQIETLKAQNHELSEVAASTEQVDYEAEQKIQEINDLLAEEKQKRVEAMTLTTELSDEIQRLNGIITQKEEEATKVAQENKEMLEQNRSLEEQQDEIDKVSYQLGKVMLDARADADTIVNNAKEQARNLISQAENETFELRNTTQLEVEALLKSAKAEAESELQQAQALGQETIANAEEKADKILATAQSKSDSMLFEAKEKVSAIASATEEASEFANIQFRELRRETLAIRQVIQEAFTGLQEKADAVDNSIEVAQETISDRTASLEVQKLMELPDIKKANFTPVTEVEESSTETPAPDGKEDLLTLDSLVTEDSSADAVDSSEEEIQTVLEEETSPDDKESSITEDAPLGVSIGQVGEFEDWEENEESAELFSPSFDFQSQEESSLEDGEETAQTPEWVPVEDSAENTIVSPFDETESSDKKDDSFLPGLSKPKEDQEDEELRLTKGGFL